MRPAVGRWITTMRLAKRAYEAASTCIAGMACDVVDRHRSRPELIGCLPHAKIAQDDHRRPADDPGESRLECRPTEERRTCQALYRMSRARMRYHLRKCP